MVVVWPHPEPRRIGMTTIILSGGACPDELALATGEKRKGEILIAGHSLLDRAVRAAAPLGPVVTVGGGHPLAAKEAPAGGSLSESLAHGWAACEDDRALILTADLPDIGEEDLREFLRLAPEDADIAYSVVEAGLCEEARPGIRRTALRLKGERLTGGNAALITREAWEKVAPLMEKAYRRRKSPLGLAALAGPEVILRVAGAVALPGWTRREALEKALSRRLKLTARAVRLETPGLANDLDSAEHFWIFQADS